MSAARLWRAGALATLLCAAAHPAAADRPSVARVETWRVDRATTGVLLEDHRAPVVEVRLVFPGGSMTPWVARAHHVGEAFSVQLRDPGSRLRARADRLALDVSLGTDLCASTLSLGCRREDLDSALALARDILANRDLDAKELARRNQEREIDWQGNLKDPGFRGKQAILELLFAEKDPRRWPAEKPRKVPARLAPLVAARDTLVRLPGRMIAFAGDLTRAEAERLAAGLLPPALDSAPPAPALPFKPIAAAGQRPRELRVPLEKLTQVYMALVRDGPALADADRPALAIANHVLIGNFYSRLYTTLRHEGGDTYSVGTFWPPDTAAGEYGPWTYTRTANADTAEAKLRRAMLAFRERGITEEERAAAAGYLQGRRAFDAQSPGQALDRWLWDVSRGLEPGYRDALVDRAAGLPLGEINDFIRRFYDPALFTLVRIEPR